MAAAAGMSVMTLRSLERGGDGVTMGAYLAVMAVLGIERDLDELAAAAFRSGATNRRGDSGREPPGPGDGPPVVPAAADDAPPLVAADEDPALPDHAAAPVAPGGASSEPGFQWLDAPARICGAWCSSIPVARRPMIAERGRPGATPDLFAGLPEREASQPCRRVEKAGSERQGARERVPGAATAGHWPCARPVGAGRR